jgi:hypothetical protein
MADAPVALVAEDVVVGVAIVAKGCALLENIPLLMLMVIMIVVVFIIAIVVMVVMVVVLVIAVVVVVAISRSLATALRGLADPAFRRAWDLVADGHLSCLLVAVLVLILLADVAKRCALVETVPLEELIRLLLCGTLFRTARFSSVLNPAVWSKLVAN